MTPEAPDRRPYLYGPCEQCGEFSLGNEPLSSDESDYLFVCPDCKAKHARAMQAAFARE